MGQLLVKCQKCGSLYPSGIVADLEEVLKYPKKYSDVKTKCPFCRHENLSDPKTMVFTCAVYG